MRDFSVERKIAILEERTPVALDLLSDCAICPRECHVDRKGGIKGKYCGVDGRLKVSSANLHFGEEPPISGNCGSGTIFLSGCNLRCVYCQNYPISQYRHGEYASVEKVAEMMIELQGRGAHNINFVTPTHFVPQLMAAMLAAYKRGLRLPIVYNSSGYEKVETLRMLDGVIEVYMPDMRYASEESSECYSKARDYPQVNRDAIKEMYRQVGNLVLDDDGVAVRGLLVRHLVLPEGIAGSEGIFDFLATEISKDTFVSLMSQYFPAHKATSMEKINRRLLKEEYRRALEAFEQAGLSNGYAQPYLG